MTIAQLLDRCDVDPRSAWRGRRLQGAVPNCRRPDRAAAFDVRDGAAVRRLRAGSHRAVALHRRLGRELHAGSRLPGMDERLAFIK